MMGVEARVVCTGGALEGGIGDNAASGRLSATTEGSTAAPDLLSMGGEPMMELGGEAVATDCVFERSGLMTASSLAPGPLWPAFSIGTAVTTVGAALAVSASSPGPLSPSYSSDSGTITRVVGRSHTASNVVEW